MWLPTMNVMMLLSQTSSRVECGGDCDKIGLNNIRNRGRFYLKRLDWCDFGVVRRLDDDHWGKNNNGRRMIVVLFCCVNLEVVTAYYSLNMSVMSCWYASCCVVVMSFRQFFCMEVVMMYLELFWNHHDNSYTDTTGDVDPTKKGAAVFNKKQQYIGLRVVEKEEGSFRSVPKKNQFFFTFTRKLYLEKIGSYFFWTEGRVGIISSF